jgi:hypothetical protein
VHTTPRGYYIYIVRRLHLYLYLYHSEVVTKPHLSDLGTAVVLADATTILLAAPAMSFKLTMGMSPF